MAVVKEDTIVSLDIGTSKVVALIAKITESGKLKTIGLGMYPCSGLRKGVVIDIEKTVNAINHAIIQAEAMAGYKVNSVYTGIAGEHVQSLNSHGIVAIKSHEVTATDIERVIEAAQAVAAPSDQCTLHTLPQKFAIDKQKDIKDPIGMAGVRLESWIHLVNCASNAVQNIERCINKCNLQVDKIILEQLASGYAVLSEDEKDLGVCLVDIGGGTTDISVLTKGYVCYTAAIPIAGDHVTNDIAAALRIPYQQSEKIKIKYACALSKLVANQEKINLMRTKPGLSTPIISRKFLAEVIEPRYREIYTLVKQELTQNGYDKLLIAGIVLTGGTPKMEGAIQLAKEVFKVPVRLGIPRNTLGMNDVLNNPIYATSVGLLQYVYNLRNNRNYLAENKKSSLRKKHTFGRVRKWFQDNF